MICPHMNSECLLIPPCDLKENTGRVYCVEWIKEQRLKGAQEREEKISNPLPRKPTSG